MERLLPLDRFWTVEREEGRTGGGQFLAEPPDAGPDTGEKRLTLGRFYFNRLLSRPQGISRPLPDPGQMEVITCS